MDCRVSKQEAEQIWQKLSYRNLTQSHKHNYRSAGAQVHNHHAYLGEWHIRRLIEEGFDDISSALGLEKPSEIEINEKNSFQLKLEKYIERDEEYVYTEDAELYWFSFQNRISTSNNFLTLGPLLGAIFRRLSGQTSKTMSYLVTYRTYSRQKPKCYGIGPSPAHSIYSKNFGVNSSSNIAKAYDQSVAERSRAFH